MTRCDGLSYNGWLYLTPRHVLDDLVGRKMLRPCSNHPTKLRMTRRLRDWLEGSIDDTTVIRADSEGQKERHADAKTSR